MKPTSPPNGKCRVDDPPEVCPLQCKYNVFDDDELHIDAWELKCIDCGYRTTQACRTDEPESLEDVDDPTKCPYCGLTGATPGINPCHQK